MSRDAYSLPRAGSTPHGTTFTSPEQTVLPLPAAPHPDSLKILTEADRVSRPRVEIKDGATIEHFDAPAKQ